MNYLHKSKFWITSTSIALTILFGLSFFNYLPAATAAENQGIEVTAPVKDVDYELGDTVKIRWSNMTVHVRAADIEISLIPRSPACLYTVPTCDMPTPAPYVITAKTDDDGSYDWTIPSDLSITYQGDVQIKVAEVGSSIFGQTDTFQITTDSNVDQHPTGSLLLGLDGIPSEGSLIVEAGPSISRKVFPSGEVFMSHGYKWEKFVAGNSADQELSISGSFTFSPGSLVKSSNNQTVYLVSADRTLRPFTAWYIFEKYGYTANMIWSSNFNINDYTVSDAITAVERHVDGTDVLQNGTVYFISNGTLRPYRNIEIYNSWHTYNNDFSRVVPANPSDMSLPIGSFQTARYYPN